MKHIFIDTNIFLHFEDFDKIDWLKESSSDSCIIVIAPIVIDELDEKKIGTDRISKKARKTLQKIEKLSNLENPKIRENVLFKVLNEKPLKSIYEQNGLNFDEHDHRLIASIFQYKMSNKLADIVLFSYDVGPRLRAKQLGINAFKPNEKYLLPVTESEEGKKLKKLEQENKILKSRIPVLKLLFDNKKEDLEITTEKPVDFLEYSKIKMNELKFQYPYLKFEKDDPYENPLLSISKSLCSLKEDQVIDYNKKLDEYFTYYEKNYLKKLYEHEKKEKLTFSIKLLLFNTGSTPAEDIDIHLHLPDEFEVIKTSEIKEPPKKPQPPYKPKSAFDNGITAACAKILRPYQTNEQKIDINLNYPRIKNMNGFYIDYSFKKLKHGYSSPLENLSIIYDSHEKIKNFQINFTLSTANIPKAIQGILNIRFKK